MSLPIATEIKSLIPYSSLGEIKEQLSPYSLEQRKFILSTDLGGSSLLHQAISYQRFAVVIYFLEECGANPDRVGIKQNEKWTCLADAVYSDMQIMVDILLRRGANINAVSFGNKTPVTIACLQRKLDMTMFLVENGANISIKNDNGNEPLMKCLYNYKIFKYLLLKGANMNLVDVEGKTVLMHAFVTYQRRIVSVLLNCQDIDVRIKSGCDEDALNLAIRTSSDSIINEVIRKGGYTNDEIIRAYELESCHNYINQRRLLSYRLWKKVLELRDLPEDMPIFGILPRRVSDNDLVMFEEVYIPALLYLKWLCGSRHVLRVRAMATALRFAQIERDIIISYKSFLRILHSLSISDFLQIHFHVEEMFRHYLHDFPDGENLINQFFEVFRCYTFIFQAKLKQSMSPSTRKLSALKSKDFVIFFIELISFLIDNYEHNLAVIMREITKFVRTYLKNLTSSSILQICFKRQTIPLFRTLLSCGADVNQTDDDNETILHYLLDSTISNRRELIQLVVAAGFDFSRVTSKRYCLSCRMAKEGFYDFPIECNTLKCLAANTICQNIVFTLTDTPPLLRTIIQTHLHTS